MLGIALSAPARAYLRQANLGLKHVLARFPSEFHIEGPKGCERVLWASSCPEVLGNAESIAEAAMMNENRIIPQQWAGMSKEPSTTKEKVSPISHKTGLPHSSQCVATPSDWGTPGHVPQTSPDEIAHTGSAAVAAAVNNIELGAFPIGDGPWPPFGWPAVWPAESGWSTWPRPPPVMSGDQAAVQASCNVEAHRTP